MLRDLELLVKLQSLDLHAGELRREIAALPKHIAVIEKTMESHQKKLAADQALVEANRRERRRLETEVQDHQQKISRLKDQMLSARNNEQYRAFQNEIGYLEAAIGKCEDRLLELMLDAESLEDNVRTAEKDLARERDAVEKEKLLARERSAADQAELETVLGERQRIAADIDPAALNLYERLNRKFAGHAIADATNGRCGACQIEMRPQLFQDLRRGDRILTCENCGRLLHYNPPVDFDPAAGGPIVSAEGSRVDMS